MLFIADSRMPAGGREKLNDYGEVIEFFTEGITYDPVNSHPDTFIFACGNKVVYAPNIPDSLIEAIKVKAGSGFEFIKGGTPVGVKYPASALYNAAASDNYLLHNLTISDEEVIKTAEGKTFINVKQGYSRCSTLPLKNDSFITSDTGIYKILKNHNINVLYTPGEGITLPGFPNGFIGGTMGAAGDRLWINGNLKKFKSGNEIRSFAAGLGYEIIELHDGALYDGGSIIIL